MKLLVALDLSKSSTTVLSVAKAWARISSAEVWLLHVAEPEPDFVGFEPGPQNVRKCLAEAFHREHQVLQAYASDFRESGIQSTALLVQGPTSETILKEAGKLRVDILVVGSHGRSALRRALMGSVSAGIVKKSGSSTFFVGDRV